MYIAKYYPYQLKFKIPGATSRGVLTTKMSYFIEICNKDDSKIKGIGECSILPKLSPDDRSGLEEKVQYCCKNINTLMLNYHDELREWPAIRFAIEMAITDLNNGGKRLWFPSEFTYGNMAIDINGLIWMGSIATMQKQIEEKIQEGFNCLKLKIGAKDFNTEFELLKSIREQFSHDKLEIRVDANGAYTVKQAAEILDKLAKIEIHSIEQPIKANQWDKMAELCRNSPLPIALDEELIGINSSEKRKEMLETIKPHYIILKPSLIGGFKSSHDWIKAAESVNAGWWVTSALESNIGLNAIAQWTATLNTSLPQGLGTGQVFSNNIASPLFVKDGHLNYRNF